MAVSSCHTTHAPSEGWDYHCCWFSLCIRFPWRFFLRRRPARGEAWRMLSGNGAAVSDATPLVLWRQCASAIIKTRLVRAHPHIHARPLSGWISCRWIFTVDCVLCSVSQFSLCCFVILHTVRLKFDFHYAQIYIFRTPLPELPSDGLDVAVCWDSVSAPLLLTVHMTQPSQ